VYTDWLIVRRLATELDRAVRSARVREAGILPDGRFALRFRARGAGADAMVFDPFGPTPAVTIEHADRFEEATGWPRAIADAVRGMRIESVRSRTGDRLIVVDLVTLSRFGVLSRYRLIVELVPNFGNILLVRDDGIVAAAREFSRERNPQRPIEVGERYTPPPLPEAKPDRPALEAALDELDDPAGVKRALAQLRASLPLLPRLVAQSLVAEAAVLDAPAAIRAERMLEGGRAAIDGAMTAEPQGDLFVYRDGTGVKQIHVVALAQFADLTVGRAGELLPTLGDALDGERATLAERKSGERRGALRARVERVQRRLVADRTRLEQQRDESDAADRLRVAGELLYAHHAEIAPGATVFVAPEAPDDPIELDPALDAKTNAAAIFKRYRKAVTRRDHVGRRLAENAEMVAAIDELAWEVEREATSLAELGDELDRLDRPAAAARGGTQARASGASGRHKPTGPSRQAPIEVALSDDVRILVGRSPRNNADLTFKVARPEDLWFHARGVPGAHVVLRIDSARPATGAELRTAAEFAAFHSKARTSGLVPVDYTQRKNVRKQQNAMPGLVWYTNAKTIDVEPRGTATRAD
jgi:predicted ribosome quality control (RQC) complex YloA/Tae2 family protein